MMKIILTWDRTLFLLINKNLVHPWLDVFFLTVTNGRFWIVPGIAIVLLLFYRMGRKRAAFLALLSIVTVLLTDSLGAQVVKPLVQRLRPCHPAVLLEGGRFLLGHKTSFAFPSLHAMNVFGQAMLFALLYRRYAPWFFLFAAIIGYSRVYVGVHYPFDVLGGAVFGMSIGAAVFIARHKISKAVTIRRRSACSDHRPPSPP